MITRTYFLWWQQWEWSWISANSVTCLQWCTLIYLRVSVSDRRAYFAPWEDAVIRMAEPDCCDSGVVGSEKTKILARSLHLAGLSQGMVWILTGALAHSPALTRIIYLKRETKQGSLQSCTQCEHSVRCEKAIVENPNRFVFAAKPLFEITFGRQEKTKTDASRGAGSRIFRQRMEQRSVRRLHPHWAKQCCPDTKRTTVSFYGTLVKWLSEARWSPALWSSRTLSSGLSHRPFQAPHSLVAVRVAASEQFSSSALWYRRPDYKLLKRCVIPGTTLLAATWWAHGAQSDYSADDVWWEWGVKPFSDMTRHCCDTGRRILHPTGNVCANTTTRCCD